NKEGKDLLILDVTDKSAPRELGGYMTPGDVAALSVTAVGTTVYLGTAANNAGQEFHVLDTANPASVVRLGGYEVGGNVNDLSVRGGIAWLATSHDAKELVILNVANPASIVQHAAYNTPGGSDAMNLDINRNTLFVVTLNNK